MKEVTIFCFLFFVLVATVSASQLSRLELSDGSVIEAKILSLDNDVYTVDTESLGVMKINASKISKINTPKANAAPEASTALVPSNSEIKAGMQTLQTKMVSNPEIMKTVTGLMSDPQFQQILKDPEIVSAVNSGNMQVLMKNEKFMNLINHPRIEEIKNKLEK